MQKPTNLWKQHSGISIVLFKVLRFEVKVKKQGKISGLGSVSGRSIMRAGAKTYSLNQNFVFIHLQTEFAQIV